MKDLLSILEGKTVGSYVFVGNRNEIEGKIKEKFSGDTALHFFSKQSFDIDTVRFITKEHSLKAGGTRFFILSFFSISIPAQNALLKILEEPSANSVFCIIVSDTEKLINTLLSRTHIVKASSEPSFDDVQLLNIVDFISTKPEFRPEISFYKKLLESKQDDDTVDKEKITLFWNTVLDEFTRSFNPKSASGSELKDVERIFEIYSTVHQQGTSIKIISEYLALTLPQIKYPEII